MSRKHLSLKIKEMDWEFNLLTSKAYLKKHGNDSDGITLTSVRKVDFDREALTLGVVMHELMHVYFDCSSTESASLDASQTEEVCATIVQEHFFDMLKHASHILNYFTTKEPE